MEESTIPVCPSLMCFIIIIIFFIRSNIEGTISSNICFVCFVHVCFVSYICVEINLVHFKEFCGLLTIVQNNNKMNRSLFSVLM